MPQEMFPVYCRRTISPRHGRALEILGHAIDYLIDELREEGILAPHKRARIEAIEILKARNREIYFDCPITPSLMDRLGAILKAIKGKS